VAFVAITHAFKIGVSVAQITGRELGSDDNR